MRARASKGGQPGARKGSAVVVGLQRRSNIDGPRSIMAKRLTNYAAGNLRLRDRRRVWGLLDGRAAEGKGKRCGGKIPWETQISASWAQSSPGTYWRKELGLPRKVRTGSRKLKGPRSRTPRAQRLTVSAQAMYCSIPKALS